MRTRELKISAIGEAKKKFPKITGWLYGLVEIEDKNGNKSLQVCEVYPKKRGIGAIANCDWADLRDRDVWRIVVLDLEKQQRIGVKFFCDKKGKLEMRRLKR